MAKRRTINDSIQDIVVSEINSMAQIEVGTIVRIRDDSHIDVQLDSDDVLESIPVIANNLAVDNDALLFPLANGEFYAISRWL